MNNAKKQYQAPELKRWGNVSTLTKVGKTRPGTDGCFGSVTWSNENCQAFN